MNKSLTYRLHEWAADRFSWVQYPNLKIVRNKPEAPKMSLLQAIVLGCFSIIALIIGAVCLGFGVFLMYVLASAIFNF